MDRNDLTKYMAASKEEGGFLDDVYALRLAWMNGDLYMVAWNLENLVLILNTMREFAQEDTYRQTVLTARIAKAQEENDDA